MIGLIFRYEPTTITKNAHLQVYLSHYLSRQFSNETKPIYEFIHTICGILASNYNRLLPYFICYITRTTLPPCPLIYVISSKQLIIAHKRLHHILPSFSFFPNQIWTQRMCAGTCESGGWRRGRSSAAHVPCCGAEESAVRIPCVDRSTQQLTISDKQYSQPASQPRYLLT